MGGAESIPGADGFSVVDEVAVVDVDGSDGVESAGFELTSDPDPVSGDDDEEPDGDAEVPLSEVDGLSAAGLVATVLLSASLPEMSFSGGDAGAGSAAGLGALLFPVPNSASLYESERTYLPLTNFTFH